jgi:DNA replication protein DnaC
MLKKLAQQRAAADTPASKPGCATCQDRRYLVRVGEQTLHAITCADCAAVCPTCYGARVLLAEDENGAVYSRACSCVAAERRIQLFNQARIPRLYEKATLASLDTSANPDLHNTAMMLRLLLHDFRPGKKGLGLSGKVGVGKSHVMAVLARELTLERGIATQFVEFTHLLADIRASYDRGQGEASILAPLVDLPVLIIDELGKGLSTEWQLAMLDELISKRYNRGATTCFTTNYPFEERNYDNQTSVKLDATLLVDRVGPRVFSRLQEMCDLHRMEGVDHRALRSQQP